jgi:hypothetical protein
MQALAFIFRQRLCRAVRIGRNVCLRRPVLGALLSLWVLWVWVPSGVQAGSNRAKCSNNMRQIILAMHNYHDQCGSLSTDICDDGGTPLLSWRVRLLNFMEGDNLLKEFHLNEPWGSSHNSSLIIPVDGCSESRSVRDGFDFGLTQLPHLPIITEVIPQLGDTQAVARRKEHGGSVC